MYAASKQAHKYVIWMSGSKKTRQDCRARKPKNQPITKEMKILNGGCW
jgi:hypothetical protein